ncbi:hypothetical protein [Phenylobacterium sp.]|jgi:hypothetical protein|uniref:hypothetical protein n=1 Tax=Phenylobacterium sp. TaxID=1871053 RepID=UPI002F93848B
MKQFIDLVGGSGTEYRFRLWGPGEAHPPIAGNFAVVRVTGGGESEILGVGHVLDLSRLDRPSGDQTALYTRLNIASARRLAEHEDLASRHPVLRDAGP